MDIYYDTGTKIKVTFTDDQTLVGIVDHWTSANDSEDGVQELTIIPIDGELKDQLVNFSEDEVSTIEIIK
ncbi:hypothetical protein [Lysinibacillus fusiformis]|uniref:Uncharacterized protein n=1 Tax=Lysinibacillus fusiformis TaxID=28031 RepID=A0A1E4R4X8_9BACI|nr:hypothetical protein [Lysinibacillus fusiformis]ODV55458.1 hypothetical protein BG258_05845 [Lysinibacillus fusiformis]